MDEWDAFMDEMNDALMDEFFDYLADEDELERAQAEREHWDWQCDWSAEQSLAYWD